LLCYVGLWRDTRRFSLDDHVCGTPLWVLAPLPPPIYLPTVPCYCIWGRSYNNLPNLGWLSRPKHSIIQNTDVQTLDQLNCAKRHLSLPREFGGLNVPSLELDVESAHYASFTATLANMIIDHESESLGPMYDIIRHELLNVATSTLPWAVQ
jgi:hypothetical protein